jgi:hypothetical protein
MIRGIQIAAGEGSRPQRKLPSWKGAFVSAPPTAPGANFDKALPNEMKTSSDRKSLVKRGD